MQMAIDKAKKTEACAAGIFNCDHIGRLSDYSKMALQHDMVVFVAVNSDPLPVATKQRTFSSSCPRQTFYSK